MQYFNLNIRKPDSRNKIRGGQRQVKNVSHSKKWLEEFRHAPIFFGTPQVSEILSDSVKLSGGSHKEAKQFCQIGISPNRWLETTIITIDEGFVWLYRPTGKIRDDVVYDEYPTDTVKSFPIEMLKKFKTKEVPLILASMKSNQAFSRGTFAEIASNKYIGNIFAIEKMLRVENYSAPPPNFSPLDCLSSLEFETLIAKIFEANGCFVAAYKGGFLKDIDLIVRNYTPNKILIDGIEISTREESQNKSIQVKLRSENIVKIGESKPDYFICLDVQPRDGWLNREWVWKQVAQHPSVKQWLLYATDWIPASLRAWS